jgi:hypothetical protein
MRVVAIKQVRWGTTLRSVEAIREPWTRSRPGSRLFLCARRGSGLPVRSWVLRAIRRPPVALAPRSFFGAAGTRSGRSLRACQAERPDPCCG